MHEGGKSDGPVVPANLPNKAVGAVAEAGEGRGSAKGNTASKTPAVNGTRGSAWARVATVLGTAGLATAAVLQAVDGVALKAVVDLWSDATEERSSLFAAALAVREVEIGLDALFALLLAAAFLAFGIGLLTAPNGSRGLGVLAVVAAGPAAVNAIALALSGFSAAAMLATTLSGVLALVWMLLTAVWSWRRAVIWHPRHSSRVPHAVAGGTW